MKYCQLSIASITSTATSAGNVVSSVDDNSPRRVKTIRVLPATQGAVVTLRAAGYVVAQFDAVCCSAGTDWLDIDWLYNPTIQFTVDVLNTTGSGYAPSVTIGYSL